MSLFGRGSRAGSGEGGGGVDGWLGALLRSPELRRRDLCAGVPRLGVGESEESESSSTRRGRVRFAAATLSEPRACRRSGSSAKSDMLSRSIVSLWVQLSFRILPFIFLLMRRNEVTLEIV